MSDKNFLIIKLYKAEMFADAFDYCGEDFTKTLDNLNALANQCGFELFFTAQNMFSAIGIEKEIGAFAEVSYTEELPQNLKNGIISALKIFSKDWKHQKQGVCEVETLSMIKFTRIENSEFVIFN